ncbi:16S rRNA (cytidine(1402)-2'-O)-methyltransferase [Candidatus Peregrinibacteria bacterium]|nr:16S rRNA (cytidine(1402)-2'-O)-methyltransferase [Candidatus Peregrinibacteria bacterium]MBT3598928.1 16S rRNA (cytidine(1402)-2'-O)-methyltransferase [Candidatus Peregrinibacteria bacterium]MBT4367004.1 16S rRNA (cytidine(1402)-2'-O)-methyltransferase [Candidatus Peregrinibacteria bacterium]MBT6730548.1 16S rRNA (cytidine(1402)-2'-O)-methyltransferase [Candidatus Peregrinibacteria bacterium]MBT7009434.1 16S rRNA (cytidine(1402)-2'-O)-methyltransferase [Candidatus Peregrinibacteria bacterium
MLSIVATPIGNLGDITIRAIETLKICDAIICEDTRNTGNLIKMLDLPKKPMISFHGYSDTKKIEEIIKKLKNGEHLVLVSDAGTPGISDPGYALTSKLADQKIDTEVIPGASAFLAALSVSGLPINHFIYLGFLPLKKGRQTMLKSFIDEDKTIVFYESVHRIEKTLLQFAEFFKDQPSRKIVIARELTKMHEEVIRTEVSELKSVAESITKKGEFVVVLGGRP